ncbi:MAG TPA: substrate-binding domain-containing protein [Clostridiaceae bacterium]|nr:substrate-binding domain-containing protein [Clostridiaceae bacterium]
MVYAAPHIDKKWIGIQKCCKRHNSNVTPLIYKTEGLIINNYDVGFQCADIIAKEQSKPTAIICANDEIAIGLINRLTSLGYNVPNDISVIGFDDINIAKHYIPSLTTIHYPKFQIGYEMARILIAMVNGESVEQNTILQTELIVRESTSPVK